MKSSSKGFNQLFTLGLIFAALGVIVSSYSLSHHLELMAKGATDAFCNVNSTFSCDDVAKSKYAEDPWGNPLGIYGIGYFLSLAFLLLRAQIKKHTTESLHAYIVMALIGASVSVVLGLISFFDIGALCLTCMTIYAICFMQAAVVFFSKEEWPEEKFDVKTTVNGLLNAATVVLLCLLAFNQFKPVDQSKFVADTAGVQKNPAAVSQAVNANLNPKKYDIKLDLSAYSGLGEDYHKGDKFAKVKVVEFADFECPACRGAATSMREVAKTYGDKILVVFKNYPLDKSCNPDMNSDFHKFACYAAVMARCAGTYGKFWQMHDKIYDNQRELSINNIEKWAKSLGLSDKQISQCRDSKDIKNKLIDDIKEAKKADLQGTPTIYINGHRLEGGSSIENISRAINYELSK